MRKTEINWPETIAALKKSWNIVRGIVSRNIGLKCLSILMALFLWSYVITTNPNITRNKMVSDIGMYVTGQSMLTSRNLALVTDVASLKIPLSAHHLHSHRKIFIRSPRCCSTVW